MVKFDAVIILGGGLLIDEGKYFPTLDSVLRTTKGVDLFNSIGAKYLILTGKCQGCLHPKPTNFFDTEAGIMVEYALEHVEQGTILAEAESNSTEENARYVNAFFLKHLPIYNALLVTNDYHTHRAVRLFQEEAGPKINIDCYCFYNPESTHEETITEKKPYRNGYKIMGKTVRCVDE